VVVSEVSTLARTMVAEAEGESPFLFVRKIFVGGVGEGLTWSAGTPTDSNRGAMGVDTTLDVVCVPLLLRPL
jgi:hypothetical protein